MVVFDSNPRAIQELVAKGAKGAANLDEVVRRLKRPRATWLMVPAAAVDSILGSLLPFA